MFSRIIRLLRWFATCCNLCIRHRRIVLWIWALTQTDPPDVVRFFIVFSFPISQCAAIYVLVCLTAAAVRLGCTTENRVARKWKHGALSPPREHELICCNITGQEGGTALSINVIVTRTGPPQLAASCCSTPLLSAAFAVRLLADNPIQSFGHVLAGPV